MIEKIDEMKFIICGRTFDTTKAQTVAIARGETLRTDPVTNSIDAIRFEDTLYRTQKGVFFLHSHSSIKRGGRGKPIITDVAEDMTAERALEWVTVNDAVIIDSGGLDLPDEA